MKMQTLLKIVGPIEIPYEKQTKGASKRIGKDHVKQFWQNPKGKIFEDKQGCYIFALKAGKGFTPWYIGKATKSLKQECFSFHKLANHFNEVLFKGNKGTPVIFFVVAQGKKKKIPKDVINNLEKFLIQSALYKNPKITNVGNTKNLPNWGIEGIIRSGRGRSSAGSKVFSKMMGI